MRWGTAEIAAWLDGTVPLDKTVGARQCWDLPSWVDAVIAHPADAVADTPRSSGAWAGLFETSARPALARILDSGASAEVKLSAMLMLAGSGLVAVALGSGATISVEPAFANGRVQRSIYALLISDALDPLLPFVDETRAEQLRAARSAARCVRRVTDEMSDDLWSIIAMPSGERSRLADAERQRLARAAEGSRLASLLALAAPSPDEETELLVRILLSHPEDGLVTVDEVRATIRLEALRASGVPHDVSRVASLVRAPEPLPPSVQAAVGLLRGRFVSSPYSALARAHRSTSLTSADMLLILAAEPDACLWIERFATAMPSPSRAAARRNAEWEREMARLSAELRDAESDFQALCAPGLA